MAVIALLCWIGPGHATNCGYDYCWGAIGAGTGGIAARASGFRTAPGATAWAKQQCFGNCTMLEPFYNGCAAIAEDFEGRMFVAFADELEPTIKAAMADCEVDTRRVCRLRVSACSK